MDPATGKTVATPSSRSGSSHRVRSLPLAPFLLVAILACCAPSGRAQPDFKFTKVDLDLLHQSDALDAYFARSGLVYEDAATVRYVTGVGKSVLPPGEPPERVTWNFHVLRDPIPNAFALPNGSIYIHTGLLSLLQGESELAGILAHEETHVLNRDAYIENRSMRKKIETINILQMASGVVEAGYGYAAPGIAAAAIGSIAPMMVVATIYGYSREIEKEADLNGIARAAAAGYDPQGLIEAMRLLEESEGPDSGPALYRDHPRLEARIQYLTEAIHEMPARSGFPVIGAGNYLENTETVFRHDIPLEIQAGRPRQAVAVAVGLVHRDPGPENYVLLGDAHRAMGGRAPDATPEQISEERKQERKLAGKLTPQEYEKYLLTKDAGPEAWKANRGLAEAAYSQALQLDASCAPAHRGLGILYCDEGKLPESATEFREYLQFAPASAWDRSDVQKRLDALQNQDGVH